MPKHVYKEIYPAVYYNIVGDSEVAILLAEKNKLKNIIDFIINKIAELLWISGVPTIFFFVMLCY